MGFNFASYGLVACPLHPFASLPIVTEYGNYRIVRSLKDEISVFVSLGLTPCAVTLVLRVTLNGCLAAVIHIGFYYAEVALAGRSGGLADGGRVG